MAERMEFGWKAPEFPADGSDNATMIRQTLETLDLVADRFDAVWVTDHVLPWARWQAVETPVIECWTTLTFLASRYPNVPWGTIVLCQSYRNPALLAKMVANLCAFIPGKVIFGIGAGWKEDEYGAYGYAYPPAGQRVDELNETLQIIEALWRDEQATVHGKHYQVEAAWCAPKPDPRPVIMVGGSKPRMLRLVARYADWWNVSWTGIANYRSQVEECERACAEVGRDAKMLRRTWFGGCICAPTEAKVHELNGMGMSSQNAFVGTPAQVIEQMRPFIDLGVDYFMLNCGGFPDVTTLEILVNEVLPALNA